MCALLALQNLLVEKSVSRFEDNERAVEFTAGKKQLQVGKAKQEKYETQSDICT
jgi:hypothetical protein